MTRRRRGGLALMVVAVAAAGLTFIAADPRPPVAAAAGKPKIFLYGDSIAWEARGWFKDMIDISGGAAKIRTFPGSDLCAWLSQIRSDVRRPLATAAVFEFGGVGLAPCLDHAGEGPTANVLQEYREDTAKVTRILARFGLRAYWVAPPGPVGAFGPSWMFPVFTNGVDDAAYDGATVVDGGQLLRKHDTKKYTRTRPCLQFETAIHGCDARNRIVVRNADGGHFCPVSDFVECPVYSSGAWRFSKNMAKNPVNDLGLTPGLFREVADERAAEAAGTEPPPTDRPPPTGEPQFGGSGVAVDTDGTRWQVDPFEHLLLHLAPDGTVLGEWWGFVGPYDVALGADGLVYVDDGKRIVTVDPATEVAPLPPPEPPPPSPAPAPEPQGNAQKVMLYGDSLTWESQGNFGLMLESRGGHAVERTFPGTAICDWITFMKNDVYKSGARAAVLSFGGVNQTPCVAGLNGSALEHKYRRDAERAIKIFARANLHVYLVAPPRRVGQFGRHELYDDFHKAVLNSGYEQAEVVDGGTTLRDEDDKYRLRGDCLPYEGPAQGCNTNGRIKIRGVDGWHFCPTVSPVFAPCPVWSGGAWRFADRLAARPINEIFG